MATEEAIVLVGGLGTRLRAVVSDVPKPLAPVAGRPFLARVLDQLAAGGMRRVLLATGHMAATVEAAIGREWSGMAVDHWAPAAPCGWRRPGCAATRSTCSMAIPSCVTPRWHSSA